MAYVKVKVLKLAGETGLRLPGTPYFETAERAALLCERGLVSICSETAAEMPEVRVKERKSKPETKELKLKRQTKRK